MENINVDKVFREYGLEVQQVEPYVKAILGSPGRFFNGDSHVTKQWQGRI